jgi:hypothetical protein
MIRSFVLFISLFAFLACTSGEPQSYGEPITVKSETAVIDIMKSPKEFHGQTVKIQGKISAECPAGCWVNISDETGMIFVDLGASSVAIPQRVGHLATIQGVVSPERNIPHIQGTGIEIQ